MRRIEETMSTIVKNNNISHLYVSLLRKITEPLYIVKSIFYVTDCYNIKIFHIGKKVHFCIICVFLFLVLFSLS